MNMFDNTSPRGFNSHMRPQGVSDIHELHDLRNELSEERERSSGLARQIAVLESALVQQQNEYEQKAFRQQQTMQEEINELDEALQEERERNAQNTRNISALESACVNEREKQSKNVLALRAQLQKAQEQLIDQTNQHDYLQRKLSSEIEILRAQLLAKRSDVGQEGSAPENALVELENEKHRTATLLAKSMELEARVAKLDELRTRQESEIEMLQKSIQGYQKEMGFIEDGLVDERERTLAQARTIHSLEEALLKQKKSQMTITSELGNTTRTSMSSNTHVHETEIRRLQDLLNDVETQLHSKIETQQSLEAINKKLNDRIQEQSKTIETLMERTMETDRENKLSQVAHPAQSGDVLQQLLILECEKTRKLEDTIAQLTVQTQKKREEQQEEHERELRQLEEEVRTWKRRASELAEDIKHSDILLHENAVS